MRRWLLLSSVLLIFVALAAAQTSDPAADQALKRGETFSKALATVTSTAISPLLGVCVMGVWEYYHASSVERAKLPFYQKPKFWIPVMALLILIFIKDTFGGFAPLIKKPLDAIEVLLVNHASLVLVVFPVVISQVAKYMGFDSWKGLFACMFSGPVVYAATAQTAGLSHAFNAATAILYTVAGFAVTFVIWLLGHSFDVLALISPFPFVDFMLKAARNAIYVVLLVTAIFSPHVAVLLCVVLIVVSVLLFGWALRIAFFGALFAWSLLRLLLTDVHHKPSQGETLPAFSARVKNVKRRTYGHLAAREDGNLIFRYRRLLLGPEKCVVVGRSTSFDVGRGIFFPSVVEPIESAQKHRVAFRLLPTYRGAEESIRICLGCAQVRDLRWNKGIRSFWKFVNDEDSATAAGVADGTVSS